MISENQPIQIMHILKETSLKKSGPVSWCTILGTIPEEVIKVKALWDTGAEATFLSKNVAVALKLPILKKTIANVATGKAIEGYYSRVNLILGNGISFSNHSVVVIDMDREDEEDLVIGMDLLCQGVFHLLPRDEALEIVFIMP